MVERSSDFFRFVHSQRIVQAIQVLNLAGPAKYRLNGDLCGNKASVTDPLLPFIQTASPASRSEQSLQRGR